MPVNFVFTYARTVTQCYRQRRVVFVCVCVRVCVRACVHARACVCVCLCEDMMKGDFGHGHHHTLLSPLHYLMKINRLKVAFVFYLLDLNMAQN